MFEAMERGELRALYVIGENPAQSEADADHASASARGPRPPGRAGHLPHHDRADGRRRAAGLRRLVRGRGHGHQQRAPRAAGAQGARPARRGAATTSRSSCELAAPAGPRLGPSDAPSRSGTSCATLSPMHAGMSYARLEAAGRHPVALLRRAPSGRSSSCTAGCGRDPADRAARRRSSWSSTSRRSSELSDEFPLRLTTGRRLDSYNTGVQTGGYSSPLGAARRSTCRRRTRGARRGRWRARARHRRGGARSMAPVRLDPTLRPGLAFMTLHFPDEVDDQRAHHRRDGPQVGHRRVQGGGDPGREDRSRTSSVDGGGSGGPMNMADSVDGSPPPRDEPRRPSATPSMPCWGRPPRPGRAAPRRGRTRMQLAAATPLVRSGICCCRRCMQLQARFGWISAGGARLHLPAADGPAGRGLRRRQLLSPVRARAAAAGGRRTCATTSPAVPRRRGAVEQLERTSARPASTGERRVDLAARAPASGMCERAPAALVDTCRGRQRRVDAVAEAAAADASAAALAERSCPAACGRAARPCRSTGDAACGCCGGSGRVDPDEPRRLPRAPAATRRCARAIELGPAGVIREVTDVEAAGPRRRRLPDRPQVGRGRAQARRARTTWSATPTSPSRAPSRTAC